MAPTTTHRLCWSTAALGGSDAVPAPDLDALGEHLQRCRGGAGLGTALRCGAEATQVFIVARLFTSVLVLSAVLGLAWLLI